MNDYSTVIATVISGVLVYLDKIHNTEKNSSYKYDGRTRCIYENGMESDILLQSLAKSLYLDGYSVTANIDTNEDDLRKSMLIADTDVASGYIYVLKSRSDNTEIASVKNLYKIGFTSTTVALQGPLGSGPAHLPSLIPSSSHCR